MITDRTQKDIDEATAIRENKIKNFIELDDSDVQILERGFMTVNTVNRIEQKQAELRSLFNAMGYWNTDITNKTWQSDDVTSVFYKEDFQRIIDNENILRNAFFVYKSTPDTPNISFHYEDINSLEKILVDLDVMINDVKSNYKECGNYYCGGE